jgi:hypothetical protein
MSSTTWLTNSKRRHEKRTYTPLILKAPQGNGIADVVGVLSVVRSLMLTPDEQTELRGRLDGAGARAALDAIGSLSSAASAYGVLAAASDLAKVSRDDLRSVAQALAAIRSDAANQLAAAVQGLDHSFATAGSAAHPSASASVAAAVAAPAPQSGAHSLAKALPSKVQKAVGKQAVDATPNQAKDVLLPSTKAPATTPRIVALASATQSAAVSNRVLEWVVGPALAGRAEKVVAWAAENKAADLRPVVALAEKYLPNIIEPAMGVTTALSMIARLKLLAGLFEQWLTERPLQPMGLLYLERMEMTPGAVERGELSYSLPLAPNEKVTLAHREWSVREEQFSEFIEDFQENFSEQGVAQTDDIALSTTTETSHTNALSMSQPVASAPGVHVTNAMDTTSAAGVDDTQSKAESKAQSRTVTALASSRTMKDHKISFTVTTVAGMEDFTAHLIENKHDDKSMRIDYFKRVRNWQSDLFRYGVRLTYDVVMPDPGQQLRQREVELQSIANELSNEFSLSLVPSDISVWNWSNLADQYGASLPSPPQQAVHVEASQTVSFTTPDDVVTGSDGVKYTSHHRVLSLNVTSPPNYQLSNLNVYASIQTWTGIAGYAGWLNAYAGQSIALANADGSGYCNLNWDMDATRVPADGQTTVFFRVQVAQSGMVKLTGTYVPADSYMEAWRLSCWTTIRDAASARFAQHRTYLRERQSILQKDIAADDPVRLRRMEREAIMRSVLEWLFPGFEDASSVLASLPSPGSLDPAKWQQVMQYGEYIKFVQTAIDWDNVMVFLYPYFWDTIWNEQEKLFLQHPDPIRREFLRAGAARVILAIQPGFEEKVVSLLDQGQLGNLPDKNRFQDAIDYVASANADFAKAAEDGGADEHPKEPGVLIGSWTDYTPSSALDIQTTLMPVVVTS